MFYDQFILDISAVHPGCHFIWQNIHLVSFIFEIINVVVALVLDYLCLIVSNYLLY